MASSLHYDGIGDRGMTVRQFAEQIGIPQKTILRYCRLGRILGAKIHPLTRKWWIYPPAKLLPK